ncbi:2-hydroxyacid dehydrogenase [Arcicella aquatica]|uniref:2-hydroxyacid dehydrogenase n=1 Tax=Arcicella aquatica TaxID=217141 RepID=A0ABU5QH72_9BACT|nr:2-hydroxyacid dehydrogenase [Arcicella aquatica]MEA5256402.1 2-hydroxyacid dehydrogenase [Arcicella aquatica]
MKTFFYSIKEFEKQYLLNANQNTHEVSLTSQNLAVETAILSAGYEAISVFTNDDASAEVLELLRENGVKYIATRSVGTDHIDLVAAKQMDIKVGNVPAYSPYSIAEHTIGMMLALNRKLILANANAHQYQFDLAPLIGFDMHGKTVGIIGLGEIGSIVAKILHGFGCNVLVYDLIQDSKKAETLHFTYVSLDTLYAEADIITLHVPFTAQTKYLINLESINKMKNGVMLINTSRGGIVNTKDILNALISGKIGYLGLDVYENERGIFFKNHQPQEKKDQLLLTLMQLENVLITGHQAFLTNEALTNIADKTIENLSDWESEYYKECNSKIGKVAHLEELLH